jgi:L-ascorbate metabolism protein UlaG (beta-lactamase superfamily)
MIIKWLGHASFLLRISEASIYVDPYAGEDLEKADLILVTHSHGDHCDLDKIEAARKKDTVMITSGDCAHSLTGNVIAMSPGDKKRVENVEVEAVEAYNHKRFRSPGVPFHPKGTQVGFLISVENKLVYHAGDTDFIPEMNQLKLKNIDLALLPCDGKYTMNLDEAVEATIAIQPKSVIPMHRRGASAEEFKKQVEAKANIEVLAIEEGSEMEL